MKKRKGEGVKAVISQTLQTTLEEKNLEMSLNQKEAQKINKINHLKKIYKHINLIHQLKRRVKKKKFSKLKILF